MRNISDRNHENGEVDYKVLTFKVFNTIFTPQSAALQIETISRLRILNMEIVSAMVVMDQTPTTLPDIRQPQSRQFWICYSVGALPSNGAIADLEASLIYIDCNDPSTSATRHDRMVDADVYA